MGRRVVLSQVARSSRFSYISCDHARAPRSSGTRSLEHVACLSDTSKQPDRHTDCVCKHSIGPLAWLHPTSQTGRRGGCSMMEWLPARAAPPRLARGVFVRLAGGHRWEPHGGAVARRSRCGWEDDCGECTYGLCARRSDAAAVCMGMGMAFANCWRWRSVSEAGVLRMCAVRAQGLCARARSSQMGRSGDALVSERSRQSRGMLQLPFLALPAPGVRCKAPSSCTLATACQSSSVSRCIACVLPSSPSPSGHHCTGLPTARTCCHLPKPFARDMTTLNRLNSTRQ